MSIQDDPLKRYDTCLRLISQISQQVINGRNPADTVRYILESVADIAGATFARLVLGDNGRLESFASGHQNGELAEIDAVVHQQTQQGKEPILIQVDQQDEFSALDGIVRLVQMVGVDAGNGRQGTLWMGFQKAPELSADTESIVQMFVQQAVVVSLIHVARTEREQLSALLVNDVEPIIIVDTNYRIRVFNPAAETLFGIEAREARGRPFEAVVESEVLVNLWQDGAADAVEYASEDGRTFSPHVGTVRAEDGTERGWLMVLRDVTRFKRLSENMSDFLHTVSHDIRSPMTAAKGYVDMLQMVGQVNDTQERFIYKILSSINDMTNLVEKVLDAGRLDPEMDVYDIRRETCDPAQIVKKVVSTLGAAAEKKQIMLTADVSPQVPVMNIDEMMVERALVNLVENAIKYTPEGGEVQVIGQVKDNYLVLTVSDNGFGISPDDQERLFERGQRVRRKEHKAIRGSGLGLFIVKNVARKHSGYATLDSTVGQGSTFSIMIPLQGNNLVGGGG